MSLEINGIFKGGLWVSTLWATGVWREEEQQEAGRGSVMAVSSISTPVTCSAFVFNQVSVRAMINEP
ncbi:MAG TPA: hypothetical protein EYN67_19340 [Flavobacteriales bacterium]|nr:hypothetical protein [Methylococcaceae bacterium]HHZ97642.1 hypothetical protein [Flavobacteriales bacterium]